MRTAVAGPITGRMLREKYAQDLRSREYRVRACFCVGLAVIASNDAVESFHGYGACPWTAAALAARNARPCNVAWIRSIVEQCKGAGVPVFVKQVGSNPVWGRDESWETLGPPKNRKGSDPEEWPEDLRVREWPKTLTPSTA